ncbi:hypothetical protein JCM19274_2115 [Algibacter lectus]|uniref:Uncharacterized protein n=1 Tax=Algibacter lectus TaxID=221126 RepID=A0A090WVC6_9FLAO|nr:hypothetical protein JCM19274_2115 [Algibacter lectus]
MSLIRYFQGILLKVTTRRPVTQKYRRTVLIQSLNQSSKSYNTLLKTVLTYLKNK